MLKSLNCSWHPDGSVLYMCALKPRCQSLIFSVYPCLILLSDPHIFCNAMSYLVNFATFLTLDFLFFSSTSIFQTLVVTSAFMPTSMNITLSCSLAFLQRSFLPQLIPLFFFWPCRSFASIPSCCMKIKGNGHMKNIQHCKSLGKCNSNLQWHI